MDLKALIQAALKKAGLPEDLHEQIKAENEGDIDGLVEEFKKTYTPPKTSLAELLKDETFKKELETYTADALKAEVDRRVTMALKTYDEKLAELGGKKKDEPTAEIKALNDKIDKLTESLTGQQEAQKAQGLKTLAVAALKEAGLPNDWIERVNVKEEAEIEGVITKLSEEMTGIKQGVIDEAIKENPIPGSAFGTPAGQTTGVIDGFVKDLKADDKSVAVVKLE